MQIIEQWLLFKYIEGQFAPFIEAVKDESAGGEGAYEVSRAGARNNWSGRDSAEKVVAVFSELSGCPSAMSPESLNANLCRLCADFKNPLAPLIRLGFISLEPY
jgi:hypothetical protein